MTDQLFGQPPVVDTYNAAGPDPMNEYYDISGQARLHDDNGNLTDDGTYTYEYNYRNELTRVTRISDSTVLGEYAYDTLSRRTIVAESPPKQAVWNNLEFLGESDDVGAIVKKLLLLEFPIVNPPFGGGDGPHVVAGNAFAGQAAAQVVAGVLPGGVHFFHENTLGSIETITTDTGEYAEKRGFEVFGKTTYSSWDRMTHTWLPAPPEMGSPTGTPVGFAGGIDGPASIVFLQSNALDTRTARTTSAIRTGLVHDLEFTVNSDSSLVVHHGNASARRYHLARYAFSHLYFKPLYDALSAAEIQPPCRCVDGACVPPDRCRRSQVYLVVGDVKVTALNIDLSGMAENVYTTVSESLTEACCDVQILKHPTRQAMIDMLGDADSWMFIGHVVSGPGQTTTAKQRGRKGKGLPGPGLALGPAGTFEEADLREFATRSYDYVEIGGCYSASVRGFSASDMRVAEGNFSPLRYLWHLAVFGVDVPAFKCCKPR